MGTAPVGLGLTTPEAAKAAWWIPIVKMKVERQYDMALCPVSNRRNPGIVDIRQVFCTGGTVFCTGDWHW